MELSRKERVGFALGVRVMRQMLMAEFSSKPSGAFLSCAEIAWAIGQAPTPEYPSDSVNDGELVGTRGVDVNAGEVVPTLGEVAALETVR